MPNKKKKPVVPGQIEDIDVTELSLVEASANGKRFAMKKAEMDELTGLIKRFFEDNDEGARFVIAKAAAAELTPEAGAAIAKALKVLVKYVADMPDEMSQAMQTLLGAGPAMEPAAEEAVRKVAKFGQGGGLDFLLEGLMLGSRNPRMINSLLKGASFRGELEDGDEELDLEDEEPPGRGLSKSIRGQEESHEDPEAGEDHWPSL